MKVDFDHWQGTQIGDTQMVILQIEQDIQLVSMLKPEFTKDGDLYCYTYPSSKGIPNDCIQGFGETALQAAQDFNRNFYSGKAVDIGVAKPNASN